MNRPTVMLRVLSTSKPWAWEDDQTLRVYEEWIPFTTRAEADEYVAHSPRPGWGEDYAAIEYQIHNIDPQPADVPYAMTPYTMVDKALELGGHGVKIGLRGPGSDPNTVYWDSRHNSFAIVKPPADIADEKNWRLRLDLSEQGVLLFSINGMGEIRWSVGRSASTWPENKEAVEHFGLTWKNPG